MTATLLVLIAIWFGIFGGIVYRLIYHNMSLTTAIIAGVFGSIFFTKFFAHLGLGIANITQNGVINYFVLVLHLFVAFGGGFLGVFILNKLRLRYKV